MRPGWICLPVLGEGIIFQIVLRAPGKCGSLGCYSHPGIPDYFHLSFLQTNLLNNHFAETISEKVCKKTIAGFDPDLKT